MCSVTGCDSLLRGAQRFRLPEDPELRLQWVQFILEVNEQQLKEASWADISLCVEHFARSCFVKLEHEPGSTQLVPGAVPSLVIKREPAEVACNPKHEAEEDTSSSNDVKPLDSQISCSPKKEEPSPLEITPPSVVIPKPEDIPPPEAIPPAVLPPSVLPPAVLPPPIIPPPVLPPPVIPSLRVILKPKIILTPVVLPPPKDTPPPGDANSSCSGASESPLPDNLSPASPEPCGTPEEDLTTGVKKNISSLLQTKGNFVVDERCLLQLLDHNCPSCDAKLEVTKLTCEALLVLSQRCLKCSYSNQWKNIAGAEILAAESGGGAAAEDGQVTAATPVSAVLSEMLAFSDEESDASEAEEEESHSSEDEEGGAKEKRKRDNDWNPTDESEFESEDDEEPPEGSVLDGEPRRRGLCTECGSFFHTRKSHTCVHKMKPVSCNICGKKCVSELSLKLHSRVHEDAYEHLCKYCNAAFKTRLDKLKHEETHRDAEDPYLCPDCPRTFATWKERKTHLHTHRGRGQYKCKVCDVAFRGENGLQRHLLVHTGRKPFECSVCERSFKQASHLKSHMRLHTGEKPYECRYCDRAFNHNVSLKAHVRRHHASVSGSDGGGPGRAGDGGDGGERRPEKVQKESAKQAPKKRFRGTGRPVGRPKKEGTSGATKKQLAKPMKSRARRSKRRSSSDESSEDDPPHSDVSSQSEEEIVEKKRRKRSKQDSDSDFIPEDKNRKKKKQSEGRGGKARETR